MSVVIMLKGRRWEVDTAMIAELRDTVSNGTAYKVDEAKHTVTHIVAVTLEPTYQHRSLVRSYVLKGDELKLSGSFEYKGETIRFELTWARGRKPAG
jgi:tRNA(Ile2) C34 agmatinyltransferase TiaS